MGRRKWSWDSDILVTLRVKPYSFKQFFDDLITLAAVTIIVLDHASKKYLHMPGKELWRISKRVIIWAYWIMVFCILTGVFIGGLISPSQ